MYAFDTEHSKLEQQNLLWCHMLVVSFSFVLSGGADACVTPGMMFGFSRMRLSPQSRAEFARARAQAMHQSDTQRFTVKE